MDDIFTEKKRKNEEIVKKGKYYSSPKINIKFPTLSLAGPPKKKGKKKELDEEEEEKSESRGNDSSENESSEESKKEEKKKKKEKKGKIKQAKKIRNIKKS